MFEIITWSHFRCGLLLFGLHFCISVQYFSERALYDLKASLWIMLPKLMHLSAKDRRVAPLASGITFIFKYRGCLLPFSWSATATCVLFSLPLPRFLPPCRCKKPHPFQWIRRVYRCFRVPP